MKRKLLSAIGLAAALSMVGLAVAGDAAALPSESYRTTYYLYHSDTGTYEPVGHETLGCSGRYVVTGQATEIANTEYTQCGTTDPESWTVCDVPEFCWF